MLLFQPFDFGGTNAKLCSMLPSNDILVHGEIRGGEYHDGRIGGLAMKVQVSALLRHLLGIPGFATTV
jgi:hypothetical protein